MDRVTNGVSVILCCYNSAKRLPETLMYLAKQKINPDFHWELIIVNNNSSDDTTELAGRIWHSLSHPTVLRIVNERKSGLSYARDKGKTVANYDTILWCDDDNWLCDTYVQTAFDIMEAHPNIGALGGWCEAIFETEKPEWFDQQARYFAVSKQGNRSGDITSKKGCVYGAGMVTRKTHARELEAQGFKQFLQGRTGKKLSSGEDTEYCYALRLLGYKMWFDERLYFKHYMTKERLHLSYVMRIRKAMAHSNFILWPYLDLLKGEQQTRTGFLKKASKGIPRIPVKKMGALMVGDFEQKAVANRYFSNLHYRLFKYNIYKENFNILQSCFSNKGSKD